MYRLLILGSLGEFVQLIKMAKSRGIYTIACDNNEDAPGKLCADAAWKMDPADTEAVAECCRREQVDGIITSFSDFLFECMVQIADRAGLKCYFSTDKLPLYRNKVLMKEMFRRLEIGYPRSVCLEKDYGEEALAELRFPVVAKPVDRYGSRGVCVLDRPEQIRERFDEICDTSPDKRVLVEEYHDGMEFNAMSWVLHGQVQIISIADREKQWVGQGEIPVGARNVYPSRHLAQVETEAREILQKVAEYTGQESGPLCMQFFWRPGEAIQVGEVAGRFFGYEHELVAHAGGLSIEKLLLDYVCDEAAIDETFRTYTPAFPRVSAVLYFHGIVGKRIAHMEEAHRLSRLSGVVMSEFFYEEGETIEAFSRPYVARYYLVGDSLEAVDSISAHIRDYGRVRGQCAERNVTESKSSPGRDGKACLVRGSRSFYLIT
ncbi:MAG: ATP-grasp domain-containing protein [Clostridiales bacterium]|nr:ATP-grasp domain-containing protein [Clostridiales bacterium]